MYARKKIVLLPSNEDAGLTARLKTANHPKDHEATLKDLPLILAARQADRIVVSLDESAVALFQVGELGDILWVNPVPEPDRVKEWLEEGRAGGGGVEAAGPLAHVQAIKKAPISRGRLHEP